MRGSLCFIIISIALVFSSCTRYSSYNSTPSLYTKTTRSGGEPFQVLTCSKARLIGDTIQLERFQYIQSSSFIEVEENGHLILVHFSGHFLEFEKDTLLDMSIISRGLLRRLNIEYLDVKYRPDLSTFFLNEHIRKSQHLATGVRYCIGPTGIQFLHSSELTDISLNDPKICLQWKNIDNDIDTANYIITIKNIFNEPLDTLYSQENILDLNLSKYNDEEKLYIIRVFEENMNNSWSSQDIAIRLHKEPIYWPKSCEIKTAIEALEYGFFLEHNNEYLLAGKYYKLASDLSDRPIFSQLYDNYPSYDDGY